MSTKNPFQTAKPAIPVVDFYGETTDWPVADLIHCEALEVRSARHNWEIKPHRHNGLLQIFYLQEGAGEARVDSTDLKISAPSVLVVPDMCVHKFIWEVDSRGFVLFIARPLINKLNDLLGGQEWGAGSAVMHQVDAADQGFLETGFKAIANEYRQQRRNREIFLESQITSLCIWLSRRQVSSQGLKSRRNKAEERFARFMELLEDNYRLRHTVTWYAEEIGISAPHLNSVCQKVKTKSALDIIHERLLLEAQRSLIYTSLSTSGISDQLGFSEPSYFIRFFKRLTGTTPKKFRAHSLL